MTGHPDETHLPEGAPEVREAPQTPETGVDRPDPEPGAASPGVRTGATVAGAAQPGGPATPTTRATPTDPTDPAPPVKVLDVVEPAEVVEAVARREQANDDAGAEHPLATDEHTEELRTCPSCRTTTGAGPYCENCGARLDGGDSTGVPGTVPGGDGPTSADAPRSAGMLVLGGPAPEPPATTAEPGPDPARPSCACGGTFADGYCEQCGSPEPDPRDHTEAQPAPWVAGVSDIGIHHHTNQDAMALGADSARAALVVADGVSTALRSEEASQAAADAAEAVLSRATSTGVGGRSSLVPALAARLDAAAAAAADAVAGITEEVHRSLGDGPPAPEVHQSNPSCTFVAAVIEDGHVVVGSIGDSRAYWFPDDAAPTRLTTDDSWAEEQISLGATREQAESGPGAHTITRWLGVDCPDHAPRTAAFEVERPGWLLLCSDGLWNYASEPAALGEVLAAVSTEARTPSDEGDVDPLALARGLVTWANSQGGRDNITVIAARLQPASEAGPDFGADSGSADEREVPTHG